MFSVILFTSFFSALIYFIDFFFILSYKMKNYVFSFFPNI